MKQAKGLLFAAVVMLAGCIQAEGTNSVDLAQLAVQVAAMSRPDLVAKAEQYKTLIAAKVNEINALKEQLKGFSWKELLGEQAKAVKTRLAAKTAELSQLNDVLAVYNKALNPQN